MTKVNVYFARPEPWFGVELDTQSEAAYQAYLNSEDPDNDSELWDAFVAEFERQMRPQIGTRGYIDEVYTDE